MIRHIIARIRNRKLARQQLKDVRHIVRVHDAAKLFDEALNDACEYSKAQEIRTAEAMQQFNEEN
ncbi:hypothetical protein phiGT1_45 [Sulfitobacter phage phiGT1]|nr:hypothetical protein phiGT1_45 [Sulfitobacter phage phiGT1]